jgi:Ca-activated chloride channel family protein
MKHKIPNAVRRCIAVMTLAGLLITVPQAWAQGEVTVQVVQVDESRFPEIDIYVSVTDADGQPVKNLSPEDFRLVESGQSADLAHVSRAGEQGPVTAVLVIDKSGSMDVEGKMEAARESAIAFVDLMRPGDVTGVIAFDTQVTVVQPLTNSQAVLVEAIQSIKTGTDTAMYDALHEASRLLESISGRKAIIAVTDGMNTAGARTLEETLTLIGEQDISIYTIGLGDPSQGTETFAGIDEETLQAIADESSGIYTFAPKPEGLRSLYELLSLRIQNEYKLTYRSPNRLRDGTNRDVAVTVVTSAGPTEVGTVYNPGGVIPEVESRSTWGLFTLFFVALAFLLALPSIIGRIGALAPALAAVSEQTKKSSKKSSKGRIRLTGEPRTSTKRRG